MVLLLVVNSVRGTGERRLSVAVRDSQIDLLTVLIERCVYFLISSI